MKSARIFLLLVVALLLLAFHPSALSAADAQGDSPLVIVMNAEGAVAPAMQEYIQRGLGLAERKNADLIILQLDTPGGSVVTMNNIVQAIRDSRIPVVVYVTPRGAMAASAGTLITLAGHASAMAPETIIGAASPIDAMKPRKPKKSRHLKPLSVHWRPTVLRKLLRWLNPQLKMPRQLQPPKRWMLVWWISSLQTLMIYLHN